MADKFYAKGPGNNGYIKNLEVLKVIPENNLILVKGSIPGAKGSYLTIEK